jgi:hypothetical protein
MYIPQCGPAGNNMQTMLPSVNMYKCTVVLNDNSRSSKINIVFLGQPPKASASIFKTPMQPEVPNKT